MKENFKAGYINIIGLPNKGKSTLTNALIGEKIAIITPKEQTTRHRILGILNTEDYQLVISDTPGIISETKYGMHKAMMRFVNQAFEDADVIFFITDIYDGFEALTPYIEKARKENTKHLLLINKVDEAKSQEQIQGLIDKWGGVVELDNIVPISALKGFNIEGLVARVLEWIPVHPPYFDEDFFTDKTERFLTSEVIREEIFLRYKQEIPYSTEVVITAYKEEETIIRIQSEIYVERDTQKVILLGSGGDAIKGVGTAARIKLEKQLGKKVFLEIFIKVKEKWRDNQNFLKSLGFNVKDE